MLHPFSRTITKTLQGMPTAFLLFVTCLLAPHTALSAEELHQILALQSKMVGNETEIRIQGNSPLVSSVYELPKPARVIVDVANAVLADTFLLPGDSPFRIAATKVAGTNPVITRFEIYAPELVSFSSRQEGVDTILMIESKGSPQAAQQTDFNVVKSPQLTKDAEVKDQVSKIIGQQKDIESQLPEINPLEAKLSPQAREQQMQDAFNFSGYNKERISVEFQKMDLHNVFNFLRQVSGVNIVVDEAVNGSLTLVLDDVPWDFALDIILNLKDLEKEERFNTLVIYPKGNGFKWPEQAENNLSFEADSAVIENEALVIQQQESQSEEVVEAKQIIARGLKAEKTQDFETAVSDFELALEKWPKNLQLANKISAIYLVRLQQNAKAMYFAQQVLNIDPDNEVALLHAGIASANMLDISKADHYFARGVQSKKPMRESILNYAAFKEEQNAYTRALSLLELHDQLYGKSLDSMISAARVSDKMGNTDMANTRYRAILTSGFRMPPDLAKFIQERVTQ